MGTVIAIVWLEVERDRIDDVAEEHRSRHDPERMFFVGFEES